MDIEDRMRTSTMDIDLRLPSSDLDKEDKGFNSMTILNDEDKLLRDGPLMIALEAQDGIAAEHSPVQELEYKDDINLEPLSGMEFSSHQEAYAFYQEYARSMGFNTAIQNSRRSKTSREFIDAKFACSRYGTKREYDKSTNRPRSRQVTRQEPDSATGHRSCGKTDCKASMHVKRRPDGKWIIHSFVKEHNHELLPAQAVNEQTRRMYAAMARQFAEYKNVAGLKNDLKNPFDKGRNSALEAAEMKCLLDFCVHMQNVNSNFFYAVDVSEDLHMKNLLWVDAKSKYDYISFNDVVSFDTTYVRTKYKMPLALFIGVNQHYQFLLLGCAFVSDESEETYSWIMHTWLKAMGGQIPKVIITDQESSTRSAVAKIFPTAQHSFFMWHVLGKVSENLAHVIKEQDNFTKKFEKCIYRSWTDEEFEKRWQKLIDRYDLKENEWFHTLYDDRRLWAPTYLKDTLLAGMSTLQRSDSVNSFFDKCVHKKTSVSEFLKQYDSMIQDRYEEEAKVESESWNRQPVLKSPSPFEKHMSNVYTHTVFKKFQVEVLGGIACHPKMISEEDVMPQVFRVQDLEKNQFFVVSWNETNLEISCICHMFEYRGYLCRHALVVLQMVGRSLVPSQYVLKRWTREAKNRQVGEASEQISSRIQRYNELCRRAMKLGEEGSLSQESYTLALSAMEEAFGNCLSLNKSYKAPPEAGASTSHGLLSIEDDIHCRILNKTVKKKGPAKKRKVNTDSEVMTIGPQDNLQHIEKLSSRAHANLDGFYNPQQGMVQLSLMNPRDNYYDSQPTIPGLPGLGLNSMAPPHDSFYSTQQGMHGLVPPGQMDLFRTPASYTYAIREESNVRSAQLHDDGQRHP